MNEVLRQSLIDLKKNKYQIESNQVESLIEEILPFIGDPDPEIRDNIVYGVLAHLFHDKHLSEERLTYYLELLMSDDYLFYDMDNNDSYSVLRRSFTILQLVIIVYVHRRDQVISKESIEALYEAFLKYFNNENILTGYQEPIGWVHAIAHSADLFAQLMQIPWFDAQKLLTMFDAIANKIKQDKYLFVSNEDERMLVAINKGLERNLLSEEQILTWLDLFLIKDHPNDYMSHMNLENNIKHLLSSLYFTWEDHESYGLITKRIKEILKENKQR